MGAQLVQGCVRRGRLERAGADRLHICRLLVGHQRHDQLRRIWVWLRERLLCSGLNTQLRSGCRAPKQQLAHYQSLPLLPRPACQQRCCCCATARCWLLLLLAGG